MVFHPSHRPLEIATRFPQFHSPDDDDISPTNKKHKGTLLSSYRGGHFYWALTFFIRRDDGLSSRRYTGGVHASFQAISHQSPTSRRLRAHHHVDGLLHSG